MFQVEFSLDQRGQGARRLRIEFGGALQFIDGLDTVTLVHARQTERGVDHGGVGRQLGGLFEQGGGLAEIACLHVGLAGQGQQLRVVGVVDGRRQRGDGVARLRPFQQGLGQEFARVQVVRIGRQVLAQVAFGLAVRAQVELDGAGQQDARQVFRRALQDFLQRFACGRVFAFGVVDQGLGMGHGQAVRRSLATGFDLGARFGILALLDADIGFFDVRVAVVRTQGQYLVESLDGFLALAGSAQHAAAEHPDVGVVGVLGDRFGGVALGRFGIAVDQGMARQAGQGRAVAGLQGDCRFIRFLRFVLLVLGQQRVATQGQQRRRLGHQFRFQFVQRFLELALELQRTRQFRQHALGRGAQAGSLAQFLLGRHRIAGLDIQGAQLQACFDIFRALRHGILQLDQGGLGIAFLLVLLGFGQQGRGGFVAAAATQGAQQEGARQGGGGQGDLGDFTGHGFLRGCAGAVRRAGDEFPH